MEEDFDAKDWVNDAFKNELQGAKKDVSTPKKYFSI